MRREKNTGEVLKIIFVIIGAVVSIGALVAVAYTVFKKYFQVTFECDGDCGDCDDCFAEEEVYEPICCEDEDVDCEFCEDDADDADDDE